MAEGEATRSKDALLARLSRLDSCAVSDALDSLGLPPAVTGICNLSVPGRIAGRVMTVRLGTERPAGGSVRHLCTAAIESAAPGDVIVIEQRTGVDAASWGGVLSNAAKFRGIAGVVIDGPARDIDESTDLGFPIYARGATARTARGRVYEQEYAAPITVDEVTVTAGDLVLADASGVVFIPAAQAETVLGAAEHIVAKERLMTEAVREGRPASAVMGADYESMLDEGDADLK